MNLDTLEAPEPPQISIQLLPSPSPFDKNWDPSQSHTMRSGCLEHLSYDQLRELRKKRGNYRTDSKTVLKTRLASTQGQNSISTQELHENAYIPVAGDAIRGRQPEDV